MTETQTRLRCDCDSGEPEFGPFDIVEAWVETSGPTTVNDPGDPTDLTYNPSGYTDVLWDTQRTVGTGCRSCGKVWLTGVIDIAGRTFQMVNAPNDSSRAMELLDTDDLIEIAWAVLEGGDPWAAANAALNRQQDLSG